MTPNPDTLRQEAATLDAADPLRAYRDEFHLPGDAKSPLVYLCGHSLGLQPKRAREIVIEELDAWSKHGVEGHFTGKRPWVEYHANLTKALSTLAGAIELEVVAMNSLTVNLHLLLASFYRPTRERHKILIEQSAFPSDRYAVESHLRWHGYDSSALIEAGPKPGESLLHTDDLCAQIERHGSEIATVLLPGVNYLTGQRFDLSAISAVARRHGCAVGFDLAHAIGNVPLSLHDDGCDFAVWCGYKYLNGGPGALGGAFVHERHANDFRGPRLAGWWGHRKATRFEMPHAFAPTPGAEGWQVSNPSVLAAAPLIASLELFERATIRSLRQKSERLVEFMTRAIATRLAAKVRVMTPSEPDARGAQLSLILSVDAALAKRAHRELAAKSIVCDWREPNVVRVAAIPFYNSYNDAWRLINALEEIFA